MENHYDRNIYINSLEQLKIYVENCSDKDFFIDENNFMDLVQSFENWLLIFDHIVFCHECGEEIEISLDKSCSHCGYKCSDFFNGARKFIKKLENENIVHCSDCGAAVNVQGLITACIDCQSDCNGLFYFASKMDLSI